MPNSVPSRPPNSAGMSGAELKAIRRKIGEALGDRLTYLDMAALIGLADPAGNGKDTYRKWEDGDGPSGPVAVLVSLILAGLTVDGFEADHDYHVAIQQWFVGFVRDRVGIVPL